MEELKCWLDVTKEKMNELEVRTEYPERSTKMKRI